MIIRFKTFENNYKDIDPFGEEDWNEEIFKSGDKVTLTEGWNKFALDHDWKHISNMEGEILIITEHFPINNYDSFDYYRVMTKGFHQFYAASQFLKHI